MDFMRGFALVDSAFYQVETYQVPWIRIQEQSMKGKCRRTGELIIHLNSNPLPSQLHDTAISQLPYSMALQLFACTQRSGQVESSDFKIPMPQVEYVCALHFSHASWSSGKMYYLPVRSPAPAPSPISGPCRWSVNCLCHCVLNQNMYVLFTFPITPSPLVKPQSDVLYASSALVWCVVI